MISQGGPLIHYGYPYSAETPSCLEAKLPNQVILSSCNMSNPLHQWTFAFYGQDYNKLESHQFVVPEDANLEIKTFFENYNKTLTKYKIK